MTPTPTDLKNAKERYEVAAGRIKFTANREGV